MSQRLGFSPAEFREQGDYEQEGEKRVSGKDAGVDVYEAPSLLEQVSRGLTPQIIESYLKEPDGEEKTKLLQAMGQKIKPETLSKLPPESVSKLHEIFQNKGKLEVRWAIEDAQWENEKMSRFVIAPYRRKLDFADLEEYLKKGASINFRLPENNANANDNSGNFPGMNLIQMALSLNDMDTVSKLFARGAQFTEEDANYMYPQEYWLGNVSLAHRLLESGYTDAFIWLIDHGANPNQIISKYGDPFDALSLAQAALKKGDVMAFEKLIEKGADINLPFPRTSTTGEYANKTLAQVVLERGDTNALRLLLEKGVSPNQTFPSAWNSEATYKGMTLLQVAMILGHTDIAMLLLDHGADPDRVFPGTIDEHRDYAGRTPIQIALRQNNTGLIEKLIERGASSKGLTSPLTFKALRLPREDLESIKPLENGDSIEQIIEKSKDKKWIQEFFGDPKPANEGDQKPVIEYVDDHHSKNGHTREDIINGLQVFFERIQKREAVLGTPPSNQLKELNAYYDNMFHRLQHIFSFLEQKEIAQDIKRAALDMIYGGSLACGTAWFNEVKSAYELLKSQIKAPQQSSATAASAADESFQSEYESIIEQRLYEFRRRCFESALPNNNTHTYNAYMRELGVEFGVAGKNSSYDDPTVVPISEYEKAVFRHKVESLYEPKLIIDFIYKISKDKTQIGEGIIPGLLADYGPKVSQTQANRYFVLENKKEKDELSGEELREYEELTKIISQEDDYTEMTLGKEYEPTREGVEYLLKALGILRIRDLKGIKLDPWSQFLIRRKQKELESAEEGSERQRDLKEWLSEAQAEQIQEVKQTKKASSATAAASS